MLELSAGFGRACDDSARSHDLPLPEKMSNRDCGWGLTFDRGSRVSRFGSDTKTPTTTLRRAMGAVGRNLFYPTWPNRLPGKKGFRTVRSYIQNHPDRDGRVHALVSAGKFHTFPGWM